MPSFSEVTDPEASTDYGKTVLLWIVGLTVAVAGLFGVALPIGRGIASSVRGTASQATGGEGQLQIAESGVPVG